MGAYENKFREAVANNESVVVITEATLSPLVNSNLQLMKKGGEKYGYKLMNVALNPHFCGFDAGTQIVATFQREELAQQPPQPNAVALLQQLHQQWTADEMHFQKSINKYLGIPIFCNIFERLRGARFYWVNCDICYGPAIIYARKGFEPSESDIEDVLKWAEKEWQGPPSYVPDFERLHYCDHFYFELRQDLHGDAKVDIKKRKTLFKCLECGRYFKFSEMDQTEIGVRVDYCHSCSARTKEGRIDLAFEERIRKLRQQGLIP